MSERDPPRSGRRFIAGAVCPECRAVDRLVIEQTADTARRCCVSCGFSDELAGASAQLLPGTRFTRRPEPPGGRSVDASPVKILSPPRKTLDDLSDSTADEHD